MSNTIAMRYAVDRYQELAYALHSDRLVYRETHWLYTTEGVTQQLVLYECPPSGASFARARIRAALPLTGRCGG